MVHCVFYTFFKVFNHCPLFGRYLTLHFSSEQLKGQSVKEFSFRYSVAVHYMLLLLLGILFSKHVCLLLRVLVVTQMTKDLAESTRGNWFPL